MQQINNEQRADDHKQPLPVCKLPADTLRRMDGYVGEVARVTPDSSFLTVRITYGNRARLVEAFVSDAYALPEIGTKLAVIIHERGRQLTSKILGRIPEQNESEDNTKDADAE